MLRVSLRARNILLSRLKKFHVYDDTCARRELGWMIDALPLVESKTSSTTLASRSSLLRLRKMVKDRCSSMPLAYAIGTQPFGPLELKIKHPILIPRPETEYWGSRLIENLLRSYEKCSTATALSKKKKKLHILDLCTGSGCLSALFSAMLPPNSAEIIAVDILPEAVQLARTNTEFSLHNDNPVMVLQADIFSQDFQTSFDAIKALSPFDIIISNPPYIPFKQWENLDSSVKNWESPIALISDRLGKNQDDGLHFYRRIATLIPLLLDRRQGIVAVECGFDQTDQVSNVLCKASVASSFEKATSIVWNDQFDLPRTVILQFGSATVCKL